MSTDLDLSANLIDVRDIIARVEELEQDRENTTDIPHEAGDAWGSGLWAEENPEDAEELRELTGILDDLKGYGGDEQWRGDWYPVTLIRDTYFEYYAQDLAEDIGAVKRDAEWPTSYIDWTAAAEELQQDYSSTEIKGTDYWYR